MLMGSDPGIRMLRLLPLGMSSHKMEWFRRLWMY